MKILAVDDELRGLSVLSRSIQKAVPDADLQSFRNPLEALDYAKENAIDIAFLDIKMPGMDGLELAVRLKGLYPKVNLIFVTGYQEHTGDAFAIHASGYVHKPVSSNAVHEQMENLRFPPAAMTRQERELGDYVIDYVARRVYYNGQDALLKPGEFHLFCLFADNVGKYFASEELYQKVWGNEANGNVHTVYVRVSALRKKLKMEDKSSFTIEHRRGKGYRLIYEAL